MPTIDEPPTLTALLAEEHRLLVQIEEWEHTLNLAHLRYERLYDPLRRIPQSTGTLPSLAWSQQQQLRELADLSSLLNSRLLTAISQIAFVRVAISEQCRARA